MFHWLINFLAGSRERRSVVLWLGAFLMWELPPIFWKGCPWFTATNTIRGGIDWWHPIAYFVALILFILWGHFDEHWRVRYLIIAAFTLLGFIIAHVATRA